MDIVGIEDRCSLDRIAGKRFYENCVRHAHVRRLCTSPCLSLGRLVGSMYTATNHLILFEGLYTLGADRHTYERDALL